MLAVSYSLSSAGFSFSLGKLKLISTYFSSPISGRMRIKSSGNDTCEKLTVIIISQLVNVIEFGNKQQFHYPLRLQVTFIITIYCKDCPNSTGFTW